MSPQTDSHRLEVGSNVVRRLYLSGTYYNTGDLVLPNSTVAASDKIANLHCPGRRDELDAPPVGSGCPLELRPHRRRSVVGTQPFAPFQVGAAYGQFDDDFTGAANRDGTYWYIEGLYNINTEVVCRHPLQRYHAGQRCHCQSG